MESIQLFVVFSVVFSAVFSVVLHEGKNREIRRILQTFEIEVLRLVRVRIGKWTLGSLKAGEIRKLSLDN